MLVPYAMLFYYSLGSVEYMTFKPGFSFANLGRVLTSAPYLAVLLKSLKLVSSRPWARRSRVRRVLPRVP